MDVYIHVCIYTYIYIYICTYIHIYIYLHVNMPSFLLIFYIAQAPSDMGWQRLAGFPNFSVSSTQEPYFW